MDDTTKPVHELRPWRVSRIANGWWWARPSVDKFLPDGPGMPLGHTIACPCRFFTTGWADAIAYADEQARR